ncbi:unnamed protein product, partial [Mesorhabditis belari]|uniref:Uncharacterized protein n=1 Tax=Mesorhabditis belari TaxID=2138241 RepID=A0AAF3F9H1_9BILA
MTTSTYVSFPLYLPDEEPFEFYGRSSDSTWSTITLFGEQVPSKPPRRFIDRDGDVYSMHSRRSRELPMGEKYAVEMVEKGKSGVRLIERPFGYDTKSFTSEIGQHQQKTDSEEAPKSDPTVQSTTTSLIWEIEPEEDVEEYVGKEVHTEGGRLDKAFTQGRSVQMAAAGNGGVDGDDSRVVTLQVGFPMEK